MYCSAFRRLAEVTQVVSAAEGYSFHNRLTHTLKVAQIARRLAEHLSNKQPEIVGSIKGVDPDAAEAAALAHDLGHPPFGHIAEEELDAVAKESGEDDGFDGNAQSFRIVTRLATRSGEYAGLNLTAATLNGILKYQSFRETKGKYHRKWGAYRAEGAEFEWARKKMRVKGKTRTVEAELMDWADDIAYSVYDVDDFYRAGLIPLDRVFVDELETRRFLDSARARLRKWEKDDATVDQYVEAFRKLITVFPATRLNGRYEGTRIQKASLHAWTSTLVAAYVLEGIQLRTPTRQDPSTVEIDPSLKAEVEILKQLVWHYVIENPALLTQQQGERTVVRTLFEFFRDKATEGKCDIFPQPYREMLKAAENDGTLGTERVRVVIDMIAGMTESQALRLHNRLAGFSLGSVLDPI